tara:strand:- start:3128 stop:3913 length:786 start_codon:yes stop_codon:yes gene_type:complete
MLKKRIIGTIVIYEELVVQSFGFKRKLPLGKPEIFIENLDRWGVDEIAVLDISASKLSNGVNFDLLKKIGNVNKNTPIAYGGGIKSKKDAVDIINLGFERVILDNLFINNSDEIKKISRSIGSQAVIISLPLSVGKANTLLHYDYLKKISNTLETSKIINNRNYFSEIMLIDYKNEGYFQSFSKNLLKKFLDKDLKVPLLVFGGISHNKQIEFFLNQKEVMGVCIGNFLNYKEHTVQTYKDFLMNKKTNFIRDKSFYKNIL